MHSHSHLFDYIMQVRFWVRIVDTNIRIIQYGYWGRSRSRMSSNPTNIQSEFPIHHEIIPPWTGWNPEHGPKSIGWQTVTSSGNPLTSQKQHLETITEYLFRSRKWVEKDTYTINIAPVQDKKGGDPTCSDRNCFLPWWDVPGIVPGRDWPRGYIHELHTIQVHTCMYIYMYHYHNLFNYQRSRKLPNRSSQVS